MKKTPNTNTRSLNGKILGSFLVLLLLGGFVFFMARSTQDKSNHSIRILLDRYPNRQTLDITFRRLQPLIDEYHYQLTEDRDHDVLHFYPPSAQSPELEFQIVRDETTRALLFLRGDADVIYDSVSIAKTEWIRKNSPQFKIFQTNGFNLSFLGFNFRNPILAQLKVRKAIAQSLPKKLWAKEKLFNWASVDENPSLPNYQPEQAKADLDQAGFPIHGQQPRFHLHYFTTPVREGNELSLMVREALKAVGIQVEITTLETALFFNRLKKGDFDLFSTAWLRFTPQDSISIFLEEKGARNYFGFSSPEFQQVFAQKPNAGYDDLKALISKELPLVPLYTWKHGLILGERVTAPDTIIERLDETFRFLTEVKLK